MSIEVQQLEIEIAALKQQVERLTKALEIAFWHTSEYRFKVPTGQENQ
jgi:hypothetical protein